MYQVSDVTRKLIEGNGRTFRWQIILSTPSEKYALGATDIKQGSGTFKRSCAGSTTIELGACYASEFDVEIKRSSLSDKIGRYELVDNKCTLIPSVTINDEKIPMGIYTISESRWTRDTVKLVSYDNMIKFDKEIGHYFNGTASALEVVQHICTTCGVDFRRRTDEVLANTETQDMSHVYVSNDGATMEAEAGSSVPGSVPYIASDCITWRDLLKKACEYMCCVGIINRDGEFELHGFGEVSKASPARTFEPSDRYECELSDYVTEYNGIWVKYQDEYAVDFETFYSTAFTNAIMSYNIGKNPFMILFTAEHRGIGAQNIVNMLKEVHWTPYKAKIPFDPCLDPMDIVYFTGNQAGELDKGGITDMVMKINGQMSIRCVGEDPHTQMVNQTNVKRFSKDDKSIAGTVKLLATGWSADKTQTVTLDFVKQIGDVIVSPEPSYIKQYATAEIYCSAQLDKALTFSCTTVPSADVLVNVRYEVRSTPDGSIWNS